MRFFSSASSVFLPYEGTQKGSQLKQLISDVITLNATNAGVNDYKIVSVNGASDATALRTQRTNLVSGKNYTVTLDYNEGGLITTITIAEVK
mgnify:FL=1